MGMLRDWGEWDHLGGHYHWNLQVNTQRSKNRGTTSYKPTFFAVLVKFMG